MKVFQGFTGQRTLIGNGRGVIRNKKKMRDKVAEYKDSIMFNQ